MHGGRHLSKHNANSPMTVVSTEESGDGMVVVHLEGENGAKADLPFSAEEAAAYPEGSAVVLHCVPGSEEEEAQETEEEMHEADEGIPIGPSVDERLAKAVKGAIPKKYEVPA